MNHRAEVRFDAADGVVTVRRDNLGIAFVRAQGWNGLFEGQGYATACDRLWHIEHDRRRARGNLAAVTGDLAHVQYDVFARRARFVDLARDGLTRLDAASQAMCSAYANGVNRRLAESPTLSSPFVRVGAPRPEPFEAWEPLAIFLVRHATFASWQQKLWYARVAGACGPMALSRFSRDAFAGATAVIVPPGVVDANLDAMAAAAASLGGEIGWLDELRALGSGLSGSNAWAVAPGRTATGAPIIAGDPHRALESPNVYYQIGLALTDEPVDAAGFSFPGVPGVGHFAQNVSTAWAVTNAMADYQDLYIERLDDAAIDRRVETVEVRGGADVVTDCVLTRHGPVVSDEHGGIGLALASSGFEFPAGSLRTVIGQLQARTVEELDAVLADWVEPVNNFVLADTTGAIAYRTAGRVPVRSSINAWLPVPGWVDTHDWSGWLPDAELPRATDPRVGAIVTANQRITTAEFPYVIGIRAAAGHRSARIWDRLNATDRFDVASTGDVHGYAVSVPGLRFAALAGGPLADWDGDMSTDSVSAAVYTVARHSLAATLVARLPEALRSNPFGRWEPRATASTPAMWVADAIDAWITDDERWLLSDDETWSTLVSAAVGAAADEVNRRTWGELHHLQPLQLGGRDRVDLGPVAGAADCVMATNDLAGVGLHALVGSTCRYVWDLGDRSRSQWVVPLGSDEDEAGPHSLDQCDAFREVRAFPVWR